MTRSVLEVGDWVRHADSNLHIAGRVVGVRGEAYVVVEWQKGMLSTHRPRSLELVMRRPDSRLRDNTVTLLQPT